MKHEKPLQTLENFLPKGAFEFVSQYLQKYKVHLTITPSRKTVLGDYRHAISNHNHRITVNGNLNAYAFLITLLHELAHLLCYDTYKNTVTPHGKEWKKIYSELLSAFIPLNILPNDIQIALQKSIQNPAASSCREIELMKVLHKYDKHSTNIKLLEDIPIGTLFIIEDGRIFKKGERLRKRFKCTLVQNKKLYLFSPVYEVKLIDTTHSKNI